MKVGHRIPLQSRGSTCVSNKNTREAGVPFACTAPIRSFEAIRRAG